jgi:hypothetical protein
MSDKKKAKGQKAASAKQEVSFLAGIPKPGPILPTNSLTPARDAGEDTAYGLSNLPPRRDLTARERDILVRVLSSLVYPFYVYNWEDSDPFYAEARAAFAKYTRLDHDAETMAVIMNVINPRDE